MVSAVALPRRLVDAFLRVRLFYKVLLANALIVGVGVGACAFLTGRVAGTAPDPSAGLAVGLLASGAVLVSLVVNAAILRVAFRPLWQLERAAERLAAGDLGERAPASPLADPEFRRLVETFNSMVDRLGIYRERYREIAARTIHAAEQERTRIALELHDDTAQVLAGLLIRLRTARSASDPEARDRLLEEAREQVADAAERVRRFARGLRPPALDMLGLPAALESHLREIEAADGLTIERDLVPLSGDLSPDEELVAYRIVQEALSNAVRHSGASRVRVRLEHDAEQVRVSVTDDGCGFSPADVETASDRGLGLFGMRERASQIGAQIEIRSVPGHGTRVQLEIPTTYKELLIHV